MASPCPAVAKQHGDIDTPIFISWLEPEIIRFVEQIRIE
jgi:hypothetical protein